MKIIGEIELKGIKRIVINRTIVWSLDQTCDDKNPEVWRKIAGGPGFDGLNAAGTRRATKIPFEMLSIVNGLLNRRMPARITGAKNVTIPMLITVSEERAYRCWPSEDTLNIVRKE